MAERFFVRPVELAINFSGIIQTWFRTLLYLFESLATILQVKDGDEKRPEVVHLRDTDNGKLFYIIYLIITIMHHNEKYLKVYRTVS